MRFLPGRIIAAASLIAFASASAEAAVEKQSSINLTANVVNKCTVVALPIMFGDVAIISGAVDAAGSVRLSCTPGIPYTVALDNGQNFNGGRRMRAAANYAFARYVGYQIYRNAARTQVWGATAGTIASGVTPADGKVNLPTYGRMNAAIVLPGAYQDIITVTITY